MEKTDEAGRDAFWSEIADGLLEGDFTRIGERLRERGVSLTEVLSANDASDGVKEEAFACACFLGLEDDVRSLLDQGVDPEAGGRSGQTGFHYAAMAGRLDIVRLLIERGVSAGAKNMYGGTVLGQALWSSVNEPDPSHPEIIRSLIDAGAGDG